MKALRNLSFEYKIAGIVGVVLVIVLIATLVSLRAAQRDEQRMKDQQRIENLLELYHAKFGHYPETLDALREGGIGAPDVPIDPLASRRHYKYSASDDARTYELIIQFEKQ